MYLNFLNKPLFLRCADRPWMRLHLISLHNTVRTDWKLLNSLGISRFLFVHMVHSSWSHRERERECRPAPGAGTVDQIWFSSPLPQGWKLRKKFAFPAEKYRKNLFVRHYFYLSATVPDITTSGNRQNFSLSFGKVPEILNCPPLFLPVPDRRTVSNVHPCSPQAPLLPLLLLLLQ